MLVASSNVYFKIRMFRYHLYFKYCFNPIYTIGKSEIIFFHFSTQTLHFKVHKNTLSLFYVNRKISHYLYYK